MAKRDNNYSRTDERADYVKTDNIEEALDYLEKQGKLKPKVKLQPKYINERCLEYYDKVVDINDKIKLLDKESDKNLIATLRAEKSDQQTKIINLSSIVIGAVIKKFKTLYPAHFSDCFTAATIDILSKINNNKYDRTKSALHSYIFETSYQSTVKYLDDKARYENSTICLIQD